MGFQISKVMDVGTGNPIVARCLGICDLTQIAQIPEEKKEAINNLCLEIMNNLIEAEKAARPLIDEISLIESKILSEGIKTQSNGNVIETPGVILLQNARTFLKFAKQTLQSLAKAMGLLLDMDFNGPHFHKITERAVEHFGEDHIISKLLKEDQDWLKEVNLLRNEDEHPKSGKRFVRGFSISRLPDGKFQVDIPRFFNDAPIKNQLEVFLHNLLTFSEEMLAFSLEYYFPKMVALDEIPEKEREPSNPKRFRVGLKPTA